MSSTVSIEEVPTVLKDLGLDEKTVSTLAKPLLASHCDVLNETLKTKSKEFIKEKKLINHLSQLAIHFKAPKEHEVNHKSVILGLILSEDIDNKTKLTHALNYSKKIGFKVDLDPSSAKEESGVGVNLSDDDVRQLIKSEIAKEMNNSNLKEEGWRYPLPKLLARIKTETKVKFADPKFAKEEFDRQIEDLLGPKSAAPPPKKAKEPKKEKKESEGPKNVLLEKRAKFAQNLSFPLPAENTSNEPKILENHLKETGGKIITRFPPEPNGYLHIGHAKSMNLNFSVPGTYPVGGYTILRFDDTNPTAEKDEYIKAIIEDVKWLGHEPKEITYSSDYFDRIYDCAVFLIKKGLAYVDESPKEVIKEGREKKIESAYRNRPVEENLKAFEGMKKGKYEEGKAVLRVKGDMSSPNPNMRDFIAYRIKYASHPHVGDKWCIYPTYDFTHCLVDSFENITHSLCTLEFDTRRESYMWELDACEVYKPVVWEFCRLNLTNTMLSKRRLIKLVEKGHVRGWDDPRLSTIRGYRRRGFTPTAINTFCSTIGVTRHNNTLYELDWLEETQRDELAENAPRVLCVSDPLKVTVTNMGDEIKTVEAPNHPRYSAMGTRSVPFSKVFYIDFDDWRAEDTKGYKRLAPGKTVGLLHLGATVTCTEVVGDKNKPTELKVTIDWTPKKGLGYIHWVARPAAGIEPLTCELRLYKRLFKSKAPAAIDDWEADINPDSLKVIEKAFIEPSVKTAKEFHRVQFERVGFFVVDPDTTPNNLVWNRILPLKSGEWEKKD